MSEALGSHYRATDVVLGLCIATWGPLSIVARAPSDRWTPAALAIASLHLAAGILIAARTPVLAPGGLASKAISLPCFAASAMALSLAPPPSAWSAGVTAAVCVAAAAAIASLATLGRSFAIFPAERPLVTRGPYALIRHPAFASEIALVVACAAAAARPLALVPVALAIVGTVLRIGAEEALLGRDPAHAAYRARTRWRLVPFVW